MKRFFLIVLCIGFLGSVAWAAPGLDIDAKLEQSADPLPFGKPATLVLSLSWDEKWPFTPPPADKLELPGLTVIDRFSTTPGGVPAGKSAITYQIVFTRFEPGAATVPPVSFETPAGAVESPSLEIEYSGAQAQPDDKPDEIRGPKEVEALSTRDWWISFAKVVGASLLALLVLALLVRKLGVFDRWLSPRSRALRQLNKLSKGLGKGDSAGPEALLEMVEVVRLYLQRAYGLTTREATSREMCEQMLMNNRCQTIRPVARTVLEHGDKAKFAQRETSVEQAQDLLEQLRSGLHADSKKKPS